MFFVLLQILAKKTQPKLKSSETLQGKAASVYLGSGISKDLADAVHGSKAIQAPFAYPRNAAVPYIRAIH